MSKKRKGPAQSGQPKKRVLVPITAESVPYIVEPPNPTRMAQERQKSETDDINDITLRQTQTANLSQSEDSQTPSEGTPSDKGEILPKDPVIRLPAETIEQRLDKASDAWMLKVLNGENIKQIGPTGKQLHAAAPLSIQRDVASMWLARRRPTLTATAVKADVHTSDARAETLTNRELAQTIIRTLRSAEVKPVIEEDRPAPKKLAAPIGAAVGEEADISGVAPPCKFEYPEEPLDPKHGEKVQALNSTGAYLRWYGAEHGHGNKWSVFNSANICVGRTPRWENAVKILMNTKPTNETRQPCEFTMNEKGFEFSDRRMEHEARRQPRVITRRGR